MLHIDHLGIAVSKLEDAIGVYEKLLNSPCYKQEKVSSENVTTAFFKVGPNKIELLESDSPDGVIGRFVQNRGEGLHHVAFAVKDIKAEMMRLKNEGFRLLSDEPKLGADNKLVCFVHPKNATGVLVELCQDMEEEDK